MLTAFKQGIRDYSTPLHSTFSRHLIAHLSLQSAHLASGRPTSVSMDNAVRELYFEIGSIDMNMTQQDVKDIVCQKIDNYISNRIIIASEVIQRNAGKKIKDGDVIMTYARSSAVEKTLLTAQAEGKRISVIIIDSGPLFEGKALLTTLTSGTNPVSCTYALLPALPSVLEQVSMVLVGAHAILANGAVYSRAGTAMVAMMAKGKNIPFLVCCETYKHSERIMIDVLRENNLAPLKPVMKRQGLPWTADPKTLNLLYDLTPPRYVSAVITEVGLIPADDMGLKMLGFDRDSSQW